MIYNGAAAFQGATLLLSTSPPAARHVVSAAFDQQRHSKQLVRTSTVIFVCYLKHLQFMPLEIT